MTNHIHLFVQFFLSLLFVAVGRLLNYIWIICKLMIKYLNYRKKPLLKFYNIFTRKNDLELEQQKRGISVAPDALNLYLARC